MALSDNIKKVREKQGMSQEFIAGSFPTAHGCAPRSA